MRKLRVKELFSVAGQLLTRGRLLNRTPFFSRDEMQAWQFRHLQNLVRHASMRVPFYSRIYQQAGFAPDDLKKWEDFRRLPCVTKDQVIAHYPKEMIASGYEMDELIVSRSSGSSGKVLDIAYDGQALVTYILAGLRLYKMCFAYRPWHRQVYVYTSRYPMNSILGLYPLHFVSTLAPMDEILTALEKLRPHLLVCYPSHLKQILQAATGAQLRRIRPRAVSVNSEMSTQAERDYLAGLLGCPVFDEYSSEELTRIAAQCRHKTCHLFEDINYIEILDGQGSSTAACGTIVGTNLHNYAMPMIRYMQNDLGKIEEARCACGWRFRRLLNFEGRRNDSFLMPSGKILSSGFLLDATYEFLLAHRMAIRDFCLIQRAVDSVLLQIVPGTGWSEVVTQVITRRFSEFLEPGVRFEVRQVTECEKTQTGKRNLIISLVNRKT